MPMELAVDLAALALYDIVIYADDSTSMKYCDNGERLEDMKVSDTLRIPIKHHVLVLTVFLHIHLHRHYTNSTCICFPTEATKQPGHVAASPGQQERK